MMPRPATTLALLVLLSAGGCVRTPDAATAPDPVGCWYFDRDATAAQLNLPWGVRLSADELPGDLPIHRRGEIHFATTLAPEREADFPFGYWRAFTRDSIEMGYPMGGGLVLELSPGAMEMTGHARAVGDAASVGAGSALAHPVRLTRAQCPA